MPIRFGENIMRKEAYSDEWYTPHRYVDSARRVLYRIELDPASCDHANHVVGAERIYTKDDDGLHRPWSGRVWCNPPYSGVKDWVRKMVRSYESGAITAGILLVNAWTEGRWFEPLYDYPMCFVRGRIQFYRPTGEKEGCPSSSVFVYFGDKIREFAAEFRRYGVIMHRYRF